MRGRDGPREGELAGPRCDLSLTFCKRATEKNRGKEPVKPEEKMIAHGSAAEKQKNAGPKGAKSLSHGAGEMSHGDSHRHIQAERKRRWISGIAAVKDDVQDTSMTEKEKLLQGACPPAGGGGAYRFSRRIRPKNPPWERGQKSQEVKKTKRRKKKQPTGQKLDTKPMPMRSGISQEKGSRGRCTDEPEGADTHEELVQKTRRHRNGKAGSGKNRRGEK